MIWTDSFQDVREILERVKAARVAVFGDFCLDAYWHLWDGAPEYSIETGLAVRRVKQQINTLGGAGSVVANLREMGVEQVSAIGVAGTDAFGETLRAMIAAYGADTSGFVLEPSWETAVYAKPYLGSSEESRIDFGSFNIARRELLDLLLNRLERAMADSDVVILNQQILAGVSTPAMIARINERIPRYPDTVFLVDSRDYQHLYKGASLKLNVSEAASLLHEPNDGSDAEERAIDFASRINAITGKPAFLTRGEHGIAMGMQGQVTLVPGLKVSGAIDTVGAGDAVAAALAAALAAGLNPVRASAFANLAAMITVKKLKTTGTASAAEIVAASEKLEYRLPSQRTIDLDIGVATASKEELVRAFHED